MSKGYIMVTRRVVAFVMMIGGGVPIVGMESFNNLTGWVYAGLSRAPELKENERMEYRYFNPEHNVKLHVTEYVQAGGVSLGDRCFTVQLPIVPDKHDKVPVKLALSPEEIKCIKSARMVSKYPITKHQIPAADYQALIWDIKEGCIKVGFVVTYKRDTRTPFHGKPQAKRAPSYEKTETRHGPMPCSHRSVVE